MSRFKTAHLGNCLIDPTTQIMKIQFHENSIQFHELSRWAVFKHLIEHINCSFSRIHKS